MKEGCSARVSYSEDRAIHRVAHGDLLGRRQLISKHLRLSRYGNFG